ncbi:MAG: M23 family metallopeptidase [Gammaproteobacteria bacterium]|nr:M23 family metallopeptidase [Gammaproteobacteria bacterium]
MSVRSLLPLLLGSAAALLALQTVAADCRDEWICVDAIDQGGNVELRAMNLRDYPITYTLRIRNRDLVVDGPTTVTRTLAPRQTQQVMLLSNGGMRTDRDYRYSLDWTVGDKDAVHDDDNLYALPYSSGASYRVMQGFGSRFSHTGLEEFAIDLDMPIGTPVHAARSGVVARLEESHSIGCWEDGCGKYANFLVVLHGDGTTGEYYHLDKDGVLVDVGDTVSKGQKIAYSGNTGHTTRPHLHFAVYRAIDWGNTQSIPVRFESADGIIENMRRGARHQAL